MLENGPKVFSEVMMPEKIGKESIKSYRSIKRKIVFYRCCIPIRIRAVSYMPVFGMEGCGKARIMVNHGLR